jgi:hypothetical protein
VVVSARGDRGVFSATGDLLATVGDGTFGGVAVHGSTVFAVDESARAVTVLQ